jgi:hypothetical protein
MRGWMFRWSGCSSPTLPAWAGGTMASGRRTPPCPYRLPPHVRTHLSKIKEHTHKLCAPIRQRVDGKRTKQIVLLSPQNPRLAHSENIIFSTCSVTKLKKIYILTKHIVDSKYFGFILEISIMFVFIEINMVKRAWVRFRIVMDRHHFAGSDPDPTVPY